MEKYVPKLEIQYINEKRVLYDESMNNPKKVYNKFKWIALSPQEEIWGIYLNCKNEVLGYRLINRGNTIKCQCSFADIIRPALLCNSVQIILIHNHPSGSTEISQEDITLTLELVKAAKLFHIDIIDHIIITLQKYISMKEKNII